MALSDYDCLAFDEKGKPSNGIFFNKGDCLEIYKNWVYIRSEKMWQKDSGYDKPYIAHLDHGNINIAGFEIVSKRDIQNSILIYATYTTHVGDKYTKHRFAGIGCRGYLDIVAKLCKKYNLKNDGHWCISSQFAKGDKDIHMIENLKTHRKIIYHTGKYNYNKDWIGVSKQLYNNFIKFLYDTIDDKEGIKWIKSFKKPLRFNQGNAYFVQHGVGNLEATPPGVKKAPMISKMLK